MTKKATKATNKIPKPPNNPSSLEILLMHVIASMPEIRATKIGECKICFFPFMVPHKTPSCGRGQRPLALPVDCQSATPRVELSFYPLESFLKIIRNNQQ